jgi:rubrerythrin
MAKSDKIEYASEIVPSPRPYVVYQCSVCATRVAGRDGTPKRCPLGSCQRRGTMEVL